MALPWVRLDTSIFDNPKFLVLFGQKRYRAVVVYVAAMAYAGKHGTGGFIQKEVLPLLQARKTEMDQLVEARLMDICPGGWTVHDWEDMQLTNDEIVARRERAQRAAAARWNAGSKR
jgi:hypothetical protein